MAIDILNIEMGKVATIIETELNAAVRHIHDKDTDNKAKREVTIKFVLEPQAGSDAVNMRVEPNSKLGGHTRGADIALRINSDGSASSLQTAIDYEDAKRRHNSWTAELAAKAEVEAKAVKAKADRAMSKADLNEIVDKDTGEVTKAAPEKKAAPKKRTKLASVAGEAAKASKNKADHGQTMPRSVAQ